MGCWNTTCGISGLPIFGGEDVVVFLLTQNHVDFMQDFVWGSTYFKPCFLPFYGEYNDYGDVEDCTGVGLPVLVEALRNKLHELELGENTCHDIPAKRNELNVEKLFELDHEDRLFIENWGYEYDFEDPLDFKKVKRSKIPLKVVHVQIKKSIFDYILENWEITETSYNSKTEEIEHYKYKFADLEKQLREQMAGKLEGVGEILEDRGFIEMAARYRFSDLVFGYLHERLGHPLLSVEDVFKENSTELLTDILKGAVINRFMDCIRKPWIKQIGNGSQNTEPEPYRLLMKAMTTVLDTEKEKYDDEYED